MSDNTQQQFFNTDPWLVYSGLLVGLPFSLLSLGLVWTHDMSMEWQWTLTVVILVMLVWLPLFLHRRLNGALKSLSNAVLSLKDGDFSIALDVEQYHGVLRQTAQGLNVLTSQLYNSRTDAAETHELLKKVMRQIDVVVMTFNNQSQLMRINDRGLELLGQTREKAIGQSAEALGLSSVLVGSEERTEVFEHLAAQQVWQLRRSNFREKGKNHVLVTLADLTAVLRQQELTAWQRMMRVLRHEISNSLAPVQSYAQTISWLIEQEPLPGNWLVETREGLEVIIGRTKALNHLMSQHRELTDLPKPNLQKINITELVNDAIRLETRCSIRFNDNLGAEVEVDKEQLNQLLLNLLKNAVEAMAEADNSGIDVSLQMAGQNGFVVVNIDDSGPGLASFDNLFVPFYTTKPQGSGIGLALCRQIAQAHGGSLHLVNREAGGCRAILSLPVLS